MVHARRVLFGGDLYEQNRQSLQTSDMSFLFSKNHSLDESVARKLMEGGGDDGDDNTRSTKVDSNTEGSSTEPSSSSDDNKSENPTGSSSDEVESDGKKTPSENSGTEESNEDTENSSEEKEQQSGGRKPFRKTPHPKKRKSYNMPLVESASKETYVSTEMSYDSNSKEYAVAVRRSPNCSVSENGRANSVEDVMERIRAIYETLGKKCKPSVSELSTTDDSNLSVQYPYLSDKSLSKSLDEGYVRDANDSEAPRKVPKYEKMILME